MRIRRWWSWWPNQFTDLVFTPSRRPTVASLTEGSGWHAIIMRDYCWTESYLSPLSAGPIWAYLNSRTRRLVYRRGTLWHSAYEVFEFNQLAHAFEIRSPRQLVLKARLTSNTIMPVVVIDRCLSSRRDTFEEGNALGRVHASDATLLRYSVGNATCDFYVYDRRTTNGRKVTYIHPSFVLLILCKVSFLRILYYYDNCCDLV